MIINIVPCRHPTHAGTPHTPICLSTQPSYCSEPSGPGQTASRQPSHAGQCSIPAPHQTDDDQFKLSIKKRAKLAILCFSLGLSQRSASALPLTLEADPDAGLEPIPAAVSCVAALLSPTTPAKIARPRAPHVSFQELFQSMHAMYLSS